MANNLTLDTGDLLITDGADNIILSESDVHEDIVEFRLLVKQTITFTSAVYSLVTFTANILQVKDFTKGL